MPSSLNAVAPGSIVLLKDIQSVFVAVGHHRGIEILELQPAGKRRMTATEFLRGHRLQDGDCFGPEIL